MTTANQGASDNQRASKAASVQAESLKPESGPAEQTKKEEVESAREAVRAAYDKVLEAKEHFKTAAQAAGIDLRNEAVEQLEKGRDKAQAISHQAGNYVHEKPVITLGAAFLAGFIVSQLCIKKHTD